MKPLTHFFIIIPLLILQLSLNSQSQPEYIYHFCPNDSVLTRNSIFETNLNETLSSLASNAGRINGFYNASAGNTAFGLFLCQGCQKLYSLAQCTPDLSGSECSRCLDAAISLLPDCCYGKKGGRVLTPSCIIRFEISPFYNASAIELPSSPPPSSPEILPTPLSSSAILPPPSTGSGTGVNDIITVESLQFNLNTIQVATNNFSKDHKLGEGGFGEVYKRTLPNGQEVAVKKLSRGSAQGSGELKNEVLLLAKLQHRNLVRLVGFCLEGEEKMLVYEYVPNKSLDYFLFKDEKRGELDWSRRYKIIGGIARGILYLHEDSRLRIVHGDLKASNILLDRNMNAKILDFRMAKIFVMDQSRGNTSRIVGTYGYMSPEYVMHDQFSVKSDMYSFGVLVLEIICGKKNSSFYQTDGGHGLVSYVWKHWKEGTPLEVLDSVAGDSYSGNEMLRCIQIGLLCVQEDAAARPTIAAVVLMLNSYSVTLPLPQKPAFLRRSWPDTYSSSAKLVGDSVDEASIAQVYCR